MRPSQIHTWSIILAASLTACGSASATEPTEAQMHDAILYAMNHPPGETAAAAPITLKFFKKEACDEPTPQGYHCTFDIQVLSTNIGDSMYNNIPGGVFYIDKSTGKWNMRPPF